jgi:hypothetical protein
MTAANCDTPVIWPTNEWAHIEPLIPAAKRGSDLRQDQRLAEGRGGRRNARCAYSDLWTVSSTPGERMFDAELHRLDGELLLDSEHLDTVENAFQRTLAIARRQESRLWGLRVAVSLARLAMTASTSLRPTGST